MFKPDRHERPRGAKASRLLLLTLGLAPVATGSAWPLRDPTQPAALPQTEPTATTTDAPPLTLTAIVTSDEGRHAIIDGAVVKVGDTLRNEGQIIAIRPGRVIIRQQNDIRTLFLVPSVKTR